MFPMANILFPKDTQSKLTLTMQFKEIEITIAAMNYIKIYKINFS